MPVQLNREGAWGISVVVAIAFFWWANPSGTVSTVRQVAFEVVGETFPRDFGKTVAVIDIDRESLEKVEPWPWRRNRFGQLIEEANALGARVIAIDVLLSGPDRNGPAALAKRLSKISGTELSPDEFADDDEALAAQIEAAGNIVLGLIPDDGGTDETPIPTPIALKGTAEGIFPLIADGVEAPYLPFEMGSVGIGALSLREGPLGRVVGVPALAVAAGQVFPGLAVETVRVASGASLLVLQDVPQSIVIDELQIPITERAEILLNLSDPGRWSERTIPAWQFLDDPSAYSATIKNKVVLLGAGAPEAGAFLPIAGLALAPTVQIQADAIDQILSGYFLTRPRNALSWEIAAILALGGVAVLAAMRLSPALAAAAELALVLAWVAVSVTAFRAFEVLIDPIGPAVAVVLAANATGIAAFIQTRKLKSAIVNKFERYVPPDVVARLVRRPNQLRLDGELCDLTALATDVEGFSRMTEGSAPQDLLNALDGYFDLVTETIVKHGGMVDKIVGDAVLAYFNIPTPLPRHAAAAVACAQEIITETEVYRRREEVARLGFGRTRCGIETGTAIVGDVGGKRRLDYTAYGAVVNKAARFEAANKILKSSICIGPAAAATLDPSQLRLLGTIHVHGMDEAFALYEPWQPGTGDDIRKDYAEAVALQETDPSEAARRMAKVAERSPGDPVIKNWMERLGAKPVS